MDPLSLGIKGVSSLLSLIPSIIQNRQAKKMMKEATNLEQTYQRPEYQMAPSIDQMVKYSRGLTNMGDIPGGNLYRNQIQEGTAAGISAMKQMGRGAEAYGGISQLVRGEQDQMRGLSQQLAQMVSQNQGRYLNSLGYKAEEEKAKWQWDEASPYLMAMEKASQLRKSGIEGRMGAFGDMSGVGANFISSLQDVDWKSILGKSQALTETAA